MSDKNKIVQVNHIPNVAHTLSGSKEIIKITYTLNAKL